MNELATRRIRFLAVFGAFFAVIAVAWDTSVVYPIKLFVVLLHEISHGLAAELTGGDIVRIEVTREEGGVCVTRGGSRFWTLSAGYLGSLLWGGLMIWGSERFPAHSRWLTGAIAAIIGLVTLFYVEPLFGFASSFGLAAAGVLVAVAWRGGAGVNRVVLTVLGLISCLYAVLDIKSDVIDRPELQSDARMLAELTGIPTVVWGLLWIALSLLFCFVLFRWAWRRA